MIGNDNASVVFGRVGDKSFVKPLVPCNAKLCERIKQDLGAIQVGRPTELFFDLSETTSIDSTFAGFLFSLTTRDAASTPSVHLIRPTDEVLTSLRALHLLQFFDILDEPDCSPLKWEAHPETKVDCRSLGQLVIDAHEKLIDADERNAAPFRPVVDRMKAEMQKRRPTA